MSSKPMAFEKIAVAVQFDDKLESLIITACDLCLKTGAALRLIHVTDPWSESVMNHSTDYASTLILQGLRDESVRVARERLAGLKQSLPKTLEISLGAHIGDPIKMIAEDVLQHQVDLVLMGGASNPRKAPGELSMAIEFATESSCPVMIIPAGMTFDFSPSPLSLTIADDLAEGGADAVAFTEVFVRKLGSCQVYHTHVQDQGEFRSSLKSMVRDEDYRSPDAMLATVRDKLGDHRTKLHQQVLIRGRALERITTELNGHYTIDLPSGTPAQEIHRSACAHRSHIVIFGQHQLFHRGHRQAGKIPFHAMMLPRRMTVIIPKH